MKSYCEDQMHYKEKCMAYSQLGYCYRIMSKHEKSLSCFQKHMELAWEQSDDHEELKAY